MPHLDVADFRFGAELHEARLIDVPHQQSPLAAFELPVQHRSRHRRQIGRTVAERDGQLADVRLQLVQPLDERQLAVPHDGDHVGHALDLGDLMAGQQHGPPLPGDVDHALQKLAPNQRIETRRRLVEDQQLRLVSHRQRQ